MRILPVAVSHGNLTVTVRTEYQVSSLLLFSGRNCSGSSAGSQSGGRACPSI